MFHAPHILLLPEIRPIPCFLTEGRLEELVDPSTRTNLNEFEPRTNGRDYWSSLIVCAAKLRTDLAFCTPPVDSLQGTLWNFKCSPSL